MADSKVLSAKRRGDILHSLGISVKGLRVHHRYPVGTTFHFALSRVGPSTIDRINIHQASLLAMGQCVQSLDLPPEQSLLLVDGRATIPSCASYRQRALVGGDAAHPLISLASILAKEYRDHLMGQFARGHIGYGFERNKGYPTREHRRVLGERGPCSLHRLSFRFPGHKVKK